MKSMDKLQAWVDGMHGSGREKQKQFLFACIQTVRECMMINLADRQLVKIDNQQIQALDKFLPFVNAHNMSPFVEALNEAYYHIERNAHGKILFLDLSLKLSRILQIK
jgi:DNA polymerase-3 subunit delta'